MNKEKTIILVVEDETDVLRINARMLTRRGYTVYTAENCRQAYEKLTEPTPDLLILDIMLPDGSGYDICERFRSTSDHPVIFLTGKGETCDKVEGLGHGGDYYLTKPYDPDELLAVADRLIKRHLQTKQKHEQLTTIVKGSLTLDIPLSRAAVNGADAGLTVKEFSLLLLLVQSEDKEVSPHELYEKVWGTPSGDDIRTIRFHIKNLRRKIHADDAKDYDIVSVYGKGYMFTTVC